MNTTYRSDTLSPPEPVTMASDGRALVMEPDDALPHPQPNPRAERTSHPRLPASILVTGTEGYLGALLVPVLLEKGHQVTGVDTGFYRAGYLYHAEGDSIRTLV